MCVEGALWNNLRTHLETYTLTYNLLTEQDKVHASVREKGKLGADSQGRKLSPISVSLVCLF